MKFTYYSKKTNNESLCFFTIRTDNDDEAFRINALTRKYNMATLLHFNCEVGVFDDSITNIQSARKLYNQIKQEAMNLKEEELVQRYYFTDDDGEEVWECFATPGEAYDKAKELANEYKSDIAINTVCGEEIVYFAYPDDESETEEAIPEVSAPVEEPEQPDDVPETASAEMSSYPLDFPYDMRIKSLCKKCKRLESCFKKDRSNVLEDIHSEPCDDVCGRCSLCCQQFESHISKEELLSLLDDELPF